MDYSLESVSFLDSHISIRAGHLNTSFYRKPMDNLMMVHFSSFHPKPVKPYPHRLCSDEEQDEHLKVLKDVLIETGYSAQLVSRQFQPAMAKSLNDLLRRQTRNTSDRVPFVVQYSPGVEKLCHVLCSLQHIDDEHLSKIFPIPSLLAFKQLLNLKQTVVRSNLPSLQDNIDHRTIQPCHGNLCKTCQIFYVDAAITQGNTTHHVHGRYS
eukprot:g35501.t1